MAMTRHIRGRMAKMRGSVKAATMADTTNVEIEAAGVLEVIESWAEADAEKTEAQQDEKTEAGAEAEAEAAPECTPSEEAARKARRKATRVRAGRKVQQARVLSALLAIRRAEAAAVGGI